MTSPLHLDSPASIRYALDPSVDQLNPVLMHIRIGDLHLDPSDFTDDCLDRISEHLAAEAREDDDAMRMVREARRESARDAEDDARMSA